MAGPLTILVGALWLVGLLPISRSRPGWPVMKLSWASSSIPFFLSFIPMLFALIGTRLRFHESAGPLGRLGLVMSVAGCAGVIASCWPISCCPGGTRGRPVSMGELRGGDCVLSIRIGYILFGVDALRYRLLPRWNLLPLLVGLTVVLSSPLDWFGVPALLPSQWANAVSALCHHRRLPDPAGRSVAGPDTSRGARSHDVGQSRGLSSVPACSAQHLRFAMVRHGPPGRPELGRRAETTRSIGSLGSSRRRPNLPPFARILPRP